MRGHDRPLQVETETFTLRLVPARSFLELRDIQSAADAGDPRARPAIDFVHRIRKYMLRGADAIPRSLFASNDNPCNSCGEESDGFSVLTT